MAVQIKKAIQHVFNPLHVYCRLRDVGLPCGVAGRVSLAYERFYRLCGLR